MKYVHNIKQKDTKRLERKKNQVTINQWKISVASTHTDIKINFKEQLFRVLKYAACQLSDKVEFLANIAVCLEIILPKSKKFKR